VCDKDAKAKTDAVPCSHGAPAFKAARDRAEADNSSETSKQPARKSKDACPSSDKSLAERAKHLLL
jgi:ribosomal protein RSM22 (predicted rRNA methylase)